MLHVRRGSYHVPDRRTVDEVAQLVDLATLVAQQQTRRVARARWQEPSDNRRAELRTIAAAVVGPRSARTCREECAREVPVTEQVMLGRKTRSP